MSLLFGERSLTLVAAHFGDAGAAHRAVEGLRRGLPDRGLNVMLVTPGDREAARKLEPEVRGIERTALRSHLALGLAGLVMGALVGALLVPLWPAAASSPGYAMLFAGAMGSVVGLLAAGLLTLRPDRGRVIGKVRRALRRGRYAVVTHPRDQVAAREASHALRVAGGRVSRSW